MRRVVGSLVIIAALCAALSGCSKKAHEAQHSAPSDSSLASATPRDGGTVIRRLDSECKTLNWVLYTTAYELFVLRHIYDPVLDYDVNGNLVPVLAAELPTVSDDHLRITVKLRPDAHWSDGVPITANDVKFTLDKVRDPKIPAINKAPYFEKLDHLEVVDDHTVTWVWKEAFAPAIYAI
ncbi:MAG TPA: ABC transporter substrate-binding protein, partial [Candidatus Krumholzibacteria bacterium]|nr:ABC transporter substrate-binding protein [Candidatus Krumholzibacteria bacterium]